MGNSKANFYKEYGGNRGAYRKNGGRWILIPDTERWLSSEKPSKVVRWQGRPSRAICIAMRIKY